MMYGNGHRGVPQDHLRVVKWYTKAAIQGIAAAAPHNLGVRYGNGRGILQDVARTGEWYGKASNHGQI